MDLAMGFTHIKSSFMADINQCRLYLGALTLSDIYTADGRRIDPAAYQCSHRQFRKSRFAGQEFQNQQPLRRQYGDHSYADMYCLTLPDVGSQIAHRTAPA